MQEGGLVNEAGKLSPLGTERRLYVPADISLRGNDALQWDAHGVIEGLGTFASVNGSELMSFVELATADDHLFGRQAVAFAQRYGVLQLCEHHLPRSHYAWSGRLERWHERPTRCDLVRDGRFALEPLSDWKDWATYFRGLTEIVWYHGQKDEPAPKELWLGPQGVNRHLSKGVLIKYADGLTRQRIQIASHVDSVLSLAQIRVQVYKDQDLDTMAASQGLFQIMAYQLYKALMNGGNGLLRCSFCLRLYKIGKKRPKTGTRNPCPNDECKNASDSERQRKSRAGTSKRRPAAAP
jgi:hypothetical protein